MSGDAVHVFPVLGVVGLDDVLDGVEGASPWTVFTIDEPRVVRLGKDAAALVYTTSARRTDEAPYRAAVTSVYRREAGRWRLLVHQQTPLGE